MNPLPNKYRFAFVMGIALLLWAALPASAAVQEVSMAELEVDHSLTNEFPTPHIQWAKPYSQGRTRVLFFIGGRGTVFRESVELMQRFDIEAAAILYARIIDTDKDNWHGGKEGVRRIETLLEKEWDAYVFLGVAPQKLPEPLRNQLLDRILAGGGAILVGVEDPVLTPVSQERREVPSFLTGVAGLKTFALGKGRAVALPARPMIEYSEGWQNVYETWQENLGRALLWAAGKDPQGRLTLSLSRLAFLWTEPGAVAVRWDSGTAIESSARLQLWIRGPVGWSAPWPDRELTAGETGQLTIPPLPAGRYQLDGRVVSSAGVVAWATASFEVTTPRQQIASLDLTKDWDEIGGKIAGQVLLKEPLTPDTRVRIDVLDKDRRVLLRQEGPATGERVTFSFPVVSWLPMLATIEASVVEAGKVTSSAYHYFHIPERHQGRFNFLIWDRPKWTLSPYAQEMLARTGVTLQLGDGNPPLDAAAHSLAWVPYTVHIESKKDAKGIMTPFCWNDTAAVENNTLSIANKYLAARQHGVFVYSLGDEIATQGVCLAETCLTAYQGYLREAYGTLTALNRSWGTRFADWESVGLSAPGDNEEKTSFEGRNYPRWFDRQAFKSWNFVQYAKRYAAAYRAMDPEARTGFEGAGRFDRGDDLDLIIRSLGFWTPYPGTADEVIRSIAPRAFPRANWMGYTKDADSLLQKYWRMVTRGMDSVWWWRWECVGRFNGWLAPDLRPYPAVKEILADTRPVREGLGDLLLQSRMQDDGIAILHSYPSTFAHKLEEGNTFGEYEKIHVAWHKAIRELGLQFVYVTDRMLRRGEFDAKRFRVLVLARAEAIGEKEAAVIRAFVKKGGLVIADVRPGIYDDHCQRRQTGILDDLFGVQRRAFLQARTAAGAVVDPGVTPAGTQDGQPRLTQVGGIPVLIGRKVGKGYALLLNGDLNILAAAKTEPLGALLERLAGVQPAVRLQREDGSPAQDLEVTRWKNGKNEILSLFRQGGNRETVTVSLPRAAQVYDLRHRKALGTVKSFRTEVLPNRASFFVLSPEAVPPVQVQIEAQKASAEASKRPVPAYAPGTVLKARLSVPDAQGDHAVLVTARFPKPPADPPTGGAFFPRTGYPALPASFQKPSADKMPARPEDEKTAPFVYPGVDPEQGEFLKRVYILGRKPTTVDVPIAYNDPTGTYELTVTDLFTQKTVTQSWQIQ